MGGIVPDGASDIGWWLARPAKINQAKSPSGTPQSTTCDGPGHGYEFDIPTGCHVTNPRIRRAVEVLARVSKGVALARLPCARLGRPNG
jgi:hypothetical protein